MAEIQPMPVIEVRENIRFSSDRELRGHLKHLLSLHERWKDIVESPGLLELARREWGPEQPFEGEELPDRPLGPHTRQVAEWYQDFLSRQINEACASRSNHIHHVERDLDWRQVVMVWEKADVIWIVAKASVIGGHWKPYVLTSGYRKLREHGPKTKLMRPDEFERKLVVYADHHAVNQRLLAVHDPKIQVLLQRENKYEFNTCAERPT